MRSTLWVITFPLNITSSYSLPYPYHLFIHLSKCRHLYQAKRLALFSEPLFPLHPLDRYFQLSDNAILGTFGIYFKCNITQMELIPLSSLFTFTNSTSFRSSVSHNTQEYILLTVSKFSKMEDSYFLAKFQPLTFRRLAFSLRPPSTLFLPF